MDRKIILTGDINLRGVRAPQEVFAQIGTVTQAADVTFGNLECCFCDLPDHNPAEREGFYAPRQAAEALRCAGFDAVGTANNVTYGEAAILASLARLDELGIAHTGAGCDRTAAGRPAIVEKDGVTYGFLQRTSIFWPKNHEATSRSPGVAVLRGHTAYRPRIEAHAADRPGIPPEVVTWADPEELALYRQDLAALSERTDFLVASHHWGLGSEILAYQTEIARAAIDSGADIVLGHGPHVPLGVEVYKGSAILYGAGNFSFEFGHHGKHDDWTGYFATVTLSDGAPKEVAITLVRRSDRNQTILRRPAEEPETLERLVDQSRAFGTDLRIDDDHIIVWKR